MEQSITLKIAGKDYPLKASSPEMEQIMRIAAEAIGKRLAQYDAKYPDKTPLDKLIIVTLNETVNRIACQKKMQQLGAEAKALQDDLEDYLANLK